MLVVYGKREHDFTATVSFVHMLNKGLQQYVDDHGNFPSDLNAMAQDLGWDASSLAAPFGSSLQYRMPSSNASETTPILIVKYRNREIVVTKDFIRTP